MSKTYVATWCERVVYRTVFEYDDGLVGESLADQVEAALSCAKATIDSSDGVDYDTFEIMEVES